MEITRMKGKNVYAKHATPEPTPSVFSPMKREIGPWSPQGIERQAHETCCRRLAKPCYDNEDKDTIYDDMFMREIKLIQRRQKRSNRT